MTAQYSYPPIHQQNGYNQYSGMGYHDHFSAAKAAGPAVNGLTFRKRQERIDWRKIASVDVDQIARMMDFNALQENITNITFCNIDAELDLRSVDPNFTKLFKLAQLTIEYLLHSQDYLAGVVSSAEEKFKSVQQENEKMTERMEKQQKEMAEIKKESHKRKKMLTAQQQLLQAGSGSYNKCPYCSKAFVNSSFLQAHLQRRHGDNVTPSQSPQSPARLNTVLEKELVEIKERLKTTESLLQSERSKSRRELFSEKNVTNILREENKENHSDSVRVIEKQDLNEDQMNELERMKNLLMVELKEMNEKYQASQNALIEMERQYGKRSHLGELRDDLDDEAELVRQQREEVAMLKEQLRQQKSKMSSGVDSQMKKQERKWEKRMQKMSTDHANELAKMNTALERSVKALEKSQNQVQKQGAATKETTAKERMINQESSRQVAKEVSKPVKTETQRKAVSHGSGASPAGGKTPGKSTDHPKRPQKMSSIDPFPDTDSEDEEELLSVGHTAGTTGEFSTQRSGRLMEQLRHDPTILKGMREELEEILAEKMEKMGVPRRSKGMSSEMLASKMSVLKTERKALDQRFPGFDDVRLRLRRHVDETAKERFKQLRRSPPSSGNRTATNSTFGSSPSVNVHQGGHTVSSASRPAPEIRKPVNNPVPVPKTRPSAVNQRSPPRPTQRSTSPIRNGNAAPLQSTGSTTEWTSTNWDSDEDEESEDGEIDNGRFGFPQSSRPVPRPRNNTPSPRNAPSPSPRTPKVQSRVTDSVSDWESDGISDLEELDLRPNPSRPSTSQTKPPPSQPRGQKVAELSQSIEFQLGSRKGKKPTGSVDTMGRSQQRSPDLQGFKDDDSFPDISSLDENDGVAPIQRPQKHGLGRSSFADTDQSSNTLGTSKWGSSSRGASPGGQVSGKDSVVSLTDWDSDISDL